MDNNDPRYVWLQAIGYVVLATIAGALSHVMRTMDAHQPVTFGLTLVKGMSAGFVGLLVMWLCQATGLGWQWTAITVGVGGWLGAEATIQIIQKFVWNKLGLNRRPDDGKPLQ